MVDDVNKKDQQKFSKYRPVKGNIFLGVLPSIKKDPTAFLKKVLDDHGSVAVMRLGLQRVILAGHPDAIKHVAVTRAKIYHKTKYVKKLVPLLGKSVLTSNGDAWVTPRQVLQKQMTMAQVQRSLASMDEIISRDLDHWIGHVDTAEASSCTTLRVICAIMLGGASDEEIEEIIAHMHVFRTYFSDICWSPFNHHRLLHTKLHRDFKTSRKALFALIGKMIDRRRATGSKDDLLGALVDVVDVETGKPLTDKRIQEEIIAALIAGHETTGQTLSFAWAHLARDPDLQERLREEAFRCLPLDQPPTGQNLKDMILTDAFLKEVQRLYPSVWWVARTALEADNIMGIPVRRGDVVMLAPYVTHQMADLWPEPEIFKADRFLGQSPGTKFMTFGMGPRVCPGVHLASLEMKIAVGRLLQRSELSGNHSLEIDGLITLRPKGGMPLDVKPIVRFLPVTNVRPGQHAFVDTLLRLRKKVFVDAMGWPLTVDDELREVDQFDTEDAEHCGLVDHGRIKAFGRLLPTEHRSLLFDVYDWLIDHKNLIQRGPAVWEGTRMGTSPDIPVRESAGWLRTLISMAADHKASAQVEHFCSVSDPTLERVLRRTGVVLERLGEVKTDCHGYDVLALKLSVASMSGKIAEIASSAAA